MKIHNQQALGTALLVGVFLARMAGAAVTNAVPWADSFESYTNGMSVVGTNGWTGEGPDSGTAVTNPAIAAYTNTGGRTYPLSTTHTGVLQTTTLVANDTRGATNGVVAVDFLAVFTAQAANPHVSTNLHYAFYIDTNAHLVIWHQNRSGAPTNEWRALTNGPDAEIKVDTNGWNRYTVIQDYSNHMFQIRLNESANYISDPVGWSRPGGAPTGTWFYMVKTDAWMSRVMLGGDTTNYVDDLLLTNRCVTWSTNRFVEAAAPSGSIEATPAFYISVSYDTFAGTNNQVLGVDAVTVTHVPAGLTGVVTRVDATRVRLTLTGQAVSNDAVNSVSNLTVVLQDEAFTLGNAADVRGVSNGTIAVEFADSAGTGTLTPDGTHFHEKAANDGTISNSLTLTLTGTTFADVPTLVDGLHYAVTNVPDGLSFVLDRNDATTVVARLTNGATYHAFADSTNLNLTFRDAAFVGMPASNVTGSAVSLAVDFRDAMALTCWGTNFYELAANNGSIGNSNTITLTGASFTNTAFETNTHYTVLNVPPGLAFSLVRDSDTQLTAVVSGRADNHRAGDRVGDLTLTFQDGAFAGGVAAGEVSGHPIVFSVVFNDEEVFNSVPYAESFEEYANGLWLAGTNGWTALYYADAGVVTNDAAVSTNLRRYLDGHAALPIVATHGQTLAVKDSVRVAVRSEPAPLVYVDFMAQPVAMQETPPSDTNVQYAFYVRTNLQLAIWHCNWTAEPHTNEWLTLERGPSIDTSRWVRFTIAQDYSNRMFQLRVNEGQPVADPAGWTAGGAAPTGSWFHMVQTNAGMSHFIMANKGQAYLDDVTIRVDLPATFGAGVGAAFRFR